jgi:hypothetical protein
MELMNFVIAVVIMCAGWLVVVDLLDWWQRRPRSPH